MNSLKTVLLASLPFLFDPASARTETTIPQSERAKSSERLHLSATSTIGDILRHPAFSGYARRVLPWDNRGYDESMDVSGIGELMPYHSAVDAGTVLGGLNRMIDDVAAGRPVFYDIYPETDWRDDPSKKNTGVFFFRGRPGAPFAIVSPGGGFAYVGSVHEGFPYAVEINQQGYNVFVLKYRVGQGSRVATQDLATAISYVFRNSETLDVATEGVARAQLSASLSQPSGCAADACSARLFITSRISATTEMAMATGLDLPTGTPIGERNLAMSVSTRPLSCSHSSLDACCLLDPIIPT